MAATALHGRWRPGGAGHEPGAAVSSHGPRHESAGTSLPYTFGHTCLDKAAAALQERKDAKWWLGKEGQATLNGTKNRDVERFWQHAAEEHVNVRGQLKQAAQANREKGLSAAGSKAALAGDANLKQETCSLYKEEFGALTPKQMSAKMAILQQAARESHRAAMENKKQSSGSNLTLETDW